MSDSPRIRRNDPARGAPIREWSNLYRAPAPNGDPAHPHRIDPIAPAGNGSPGVAPDDASAAAEPTLDAEARAGIDTAYRVIDEHLREGRRAAEARSGSGPTAGPAAAADAAGAAAADGFQEIIAQGGRLYASLAPLWAGLFKAIATPAADAPAAGAPVVVEIASARMARVTVDLQRQAEAKNLALAGLHALEPGLSPLTGVEFAAEPGTNRVIVRIRVPAGQPAGDYSGAIVDRETGRPCGTIALRLGD